MSRRATVDGMTLVPALLRAIVTVDGDALVLQAGEKAYVASAAGPISLSSGGMSTEAVSDVIGQLLPLESQQILTQCGAVQHELKELGDFPGEQFQVVATNEGTILGVEIRRQHRLSASIGRGQPSRVSAALASSEPATAPALPHPPAVIVDELEMLMHLVSRAVAAGASALHIVAGIPPRVRTGEGLVLLPGASSFSVQQVEALLRQGPAVALDVETEMREWFWDFGELGRMRCCSLLDYRGPGLVLRSVPTHPVTSRQLGLSREIEELAGRREGLVFVASPRGDLARVVLGALVDFINHTRNVHLISVEREVSVLYESDAALISQREAGRSLERLLTCARAALREDPDVLVIDAVQTPDLMSLAFDAAHSGRLVLAATRGASGVGVLEDIVSLYPRSQRQRALVSCARTLSAVVVEPAEAKAIRAEMRQLLLNTPDVAHLIAEGRFGELAQRNGHR